MILTTILILPCIEGDNTQNIQYIKNFQINSLGIFLAIQKTMRISWFHRPVIPSLNAYGVSCRIRVCELSYLIHSRFTPSTLRTNMGPPFSYKTKEIKQIIFFNIFA